MAFFDRLEFSDSINFSIYLFLDIRFSLNCTIILYPLITYLIIFDALILCFSSVCSFLILCFSICSCSLSIFPSLIAGIIAVVTNKYIVTAKTMYIRKETIYVIINFFLSFLSTDIDSYSISSSSFGFSLNSSFSKTNLEELSGVSTLSKTFSTLFSLVIFIFFCAVESSLSAFAFSNFSFFFSAFLAALFSFSV